MNLSSAPNVDRALAEILKDASAGEKIKTLLGEEPDQLFAFFQSKGYDFSATEWLAALERLRAGELSEDQLADVAGGNWFSDWFSSSEGTDSWERVTKKLKRR